jgi:hypothetical protein
MIMRKWLQRISVFLLVMLPLYGFTTDANDQMAQVFPTSTPAPVFLPTATLPPTAGLPQPTIAPTFTPQAEVAVSLQAREEAGSVNVRADADPEADEVGRIVYGDLYPVLGRYFRWLQISFDSSPSGVGWVYDELVEIVGDEASIPDLTQITEPTLDPSINAPTQTYEALLQTPGAFETATAGARVLEAPSAGNSALGSINPQDVGANPIVEILPTFTYPANLVGQMPTTNPLVESTAVGTNALVATTSGNSVAPILPIAILVGAGLMGLLVSSIRR